MRATFTTEFIYDGTDGFLERKAKMCEVLDIKMDLKGGSCIGQLAGIISGLSLAEEDINRWLNEQVYKLAKITVVPFRIVYLFEGGDLVCKNVWVKKKDLLAILKTKA